MDRRVREVLDRLTADLRRSLSVPELAASVNLGASRLEHLFRTTLRTSIRELVRTRRIAEAARLLLTTHMRVSEIGHDVGFNDLSNFDHAFRRHFGVSPRDYRKCNGGNEGDPSGSGS
ncbi:MAG TPA: AraC family transcriptional regulator [Thermoanaerobaculia bacterium]|nr:AraC family transcriptional regulator [Thermoanaerobaculia bacterium]